MCFLLFKKLYGASLIVACGSKCGHDNDVFFSKVYPRLLLIKENKRNNCPLMKLNRLNSHFIVDRFTNTYSVDDCNGYPIFTTNLVANFSLTKGQRFKCYTTLHYTTLHYTTLHYTTLPHFAAKTTNLSTRT